MNQPREIISLQHPLVKHFVRLHTNRDYRDDHQSVLIESKKLLQEVCVKYPTKVIMTTDLLNIPAGIKAEEVFLVTENIIHKVSGVLKPEGIIAEVAMPPSAILKGLKYLIACDGINDPGNLGTILRTALALGAEGAFIVNNSCDPFNDKALRAAKGATFRLPIARGPWEQLQKLIADNQLQPIAADISGVDLDTVKLKKKIILILGNEAHGLSAEAKDYLKVKIPMPGEMESLNVAVAAGICMYALQRKC